MDFKKGSSPNRVSEKIPSKGLPHRSRGCVPSMAGQNRREEARVRSSPLSSARHLSPIPLPKTEPLVRPGQPKKFPTRTHKRTTASLCPAMDRMRPLGPGQSPPTGRENMGRWIIDRNHPLDWEKTLKKNHERFRKPSPEPESHGSHWPPPGCLR